MKRSGLLLVTLLTALLHGCASAPPRGTDDLCQLFAEERAWYRDAAKASQRWQIPVPILLAFVDRESGFRARAKPPRRKWLGFIPGPRPSSAYGFAQATDEAWSDYRRATGRWGADRNDFGDAIDFIGWYNDTSHRLQGMARSDPYQLYLAYHEGQQGYRSGAWRRKPWLQDLARKVAQRASRYQDQLASCEHRLRRRRFLWFF